eukprot:2554600-Amphidinium_carterae.3
MPGRPHNVGAEATSTRCSPITSARDNAPANGSTQTLSVGKLLRIRLAQQLPKHNRGRTKGANTVGHQCHKGRPAWQTWASCGQSIRTSFSALRLCQVVQRIRACWTVRNDDITNILLSARRCENHVRPVHGWRHIRRIRRHRDILFDGRMPTSLQGDVFPRITYQVVSSKA